VLTIPNTAAQIRGGPNPENGAILMQFLLSEELEQLLVESDSHNSPVHAQIAQKYPQYAIGSPLRIDYARIADFLPEAIRAAREVLE
jgi:ABC-type Fe3+ transport system substrate-binding protein